jgi:methionyl-tRNA synthetase
MSKFYITTSIPYVNGEPHLGHAMEFVQGDALARYLRARDVEVLFSTGVDEHGAKNLEKAAQNNLEPQAFVDNMSQHFVELCKRLNISNDRFIRTTNPAHKEAVKYLWQQMAAKGDIYKGTYKGYYDVGEEEFVTETEARKNKGISPHNGRPYEVLQEENYFFKLSKYADSVRQLIESNQYLVVPENYKNEILSLLKQGVQDISFSRPKEKLPWGVEVPGDPNHVMYVWPDALGNYITLLGYPGGADFTKFWPADVHIIGKNIIRFHAIIWPAMLMSLGLALPKRLYVHGFITVDGKKMGKSLGNAIAPDEIIQKYGTDAFRYFFLRHIPSYQDGDFSWERMEAAYNDELADQLGNAVSRTAAMITQFQKGVVGEIPAAGHDFTQYEESMESFRFDRALDEVWEQIKGLNQYIEETKPWALAKLKDEEHLREVLATTTSNLLEIAQLLVPFMPDTAAKIQGVFGTGMLQPLPTSLFPKQEQPKASPQQAPAA